MAARAEVAVRSPDLSGENAADSAALTAGLAYVERCLRAHRSFGILTGSVKPMCFLVARASASLGGRDDLHLVRLTTPTDSVYVFLSGLLGQLGFELGQAGQDDLHNLFVVFLKHEAARGRRTVAIIEAAEQCGPRVLEYLEVLCKVRGGPTPAITFLLAGSRDLHRVLDSPGMARIRQLTRERFDLDRSLAWVRPPGVPADGRDLARGAPAHPGRLVVMADGVILERRTLVPGRLVIGRSAGAGLRLDSCYVSRHHAALLVMPDSVTVVDLRSTNSTLVNGEPVSSQRLEHGDLLTIGKFRLRYDCRPGTDEAAAS